MARTVTHLLRVLETFQALGIDFISLSEAIDTSTPAGKMTFTVLGAVAELERSLIIERVKAGLRNAALPLKFTRDLISGQTVVWRIPCPLQQIPIDAARE